MVVLNELDAKIAALEKSLKGCASESDSSSSSGVSEEVEDAVSDSDGFSGYSCDSSSSEESDDEPEPVKPVSADGVDYAKKATQIARKKARLGMSSICFSHVLGQCELSDCVFEHKTLEKLSEEERGELMRELRRKPFEESLGAKVKAMNIPVCKAFGKNLCKFMKCRFWHIETENDARWAGSPFWCQPCRKAFTSQIQLQEHSAGKLHKANSNRY